MASSKRQRQTSDRASEAGSRELDRKNAFPSSASVFSGAVEAALLQVPAAFFSSADPAAHPIAVAYSGGVDSTVLLHTLAELRQSRGLKTIALHVHHGLSPNADAWLAHCAYETAARQIPFFHERVRLRVDGGGSLEADAREARYGALERLCVHHGVKILLTAHHADDQAETVMLNLMRGSGIAGLAGAARQRFLGSAQTVLLLRPLQDIGSETIRRHASDADLRFIEDESNRDRRHTRNALRHEVMPALKRIFPTATARLAQTAAHSVEAQALLDDIGQEDLETMRLEAGLGASELSRDGLKMLSRKRATNALRVWFRSRAKRAPSAAALEEMLSQLLAGRDEAQISLIHEDLALYVYRGRVYVKPVSGRVANSAKAAHAADRQIPWNGEPSLELGDWDGRLVFEIGADTGVAAARLRNGFVSVRERQGGERLKLDSKRPSRTLKNLYQEKGVPPWQRGALPLVYLDGALIFAAGLGMDVRQTSGPETSGKLDGSDTAEDEPLIAMSWEPDV